MSLTDYDFSKPLGKRRPKVMERMPDPPPLPYFEIDENKLNSALPAPESESSAWEDLRMVAFLFVGPLLIVLGLILLVASLI